MLSIYWDLSCLDILVLNSFRELVYESKFALFKVCKIVQKKLILGINSL